MAARQSIEQALHRLEKLRQRIGKSTGLSCALFGDESGLMLPRKNPGFLDDKGVGQLLERVLENGTSGVEKMQNGLWAAGFPVFLGGDGVCVWVVLGFVYEQGGEAANADAGVPKFNETALLALGESIVGLTTELIEVQKSSRLAYTNRLLGIPNHLAMEQEIATGRWQHLLILDIGDLRKVNDVYGRECGDLLLRSVSQYIQGLEIPDSSLFRPDISDFAILLDGYNEERLQALVKKIHDRCNAPWPLETGLQKQDIFIRLNIGVLPLDKDNAFHNLTSAIEHTMDIAQRNKQGIALFDDQENTSFRDRVRLELSLRQAVRDNMNGFYVVYQPIVDPGTAVWSGMEALCRWNSKEFGSVPPTTFIEIAEGAGLIYPIGHWVLDQALGAVKNWQLDKNENFTLDVNLSPVQLLNPELFDDIVGLLTKHSYPPKNLCLEITESNELNFTQHSMEVVRKLDELGVLIALDDFGAGYATLHSLHRLPAKVVKTDRALITNVENDIFLQRLFNVMVEVAHASDMKIVAEGVETDEQAMLLLRSGADLFQGFNFSRPLEAAQIDEMLQNFKNPVGEVIAMNYTRFDVDRLSDEEGGYDLTPDLYKLLNRCMKALFSIKDGDEAISTALQYVGEGIGVSRSYVFMQEKDGTYTNTHEWCAEGVKPEIGNLTHLDIPGIAPQWVDTLITDGLLVASDINDLDPGSFDVLIEQGIKAVVEFAIMRDDKLIAFVGFDDCNGIHYWSKEEIQMLHTLTGIIATTLARSELEHRVFTQSERMRNMLNEMDTYIYVSDLETNEILFANSDLQKRYDHPLMGHTCWEALQDESEQCSFCPIPYLLENPGKSYQWEYYNEKVNTHFRISDSIIPWDNGKMVHFEYALDITELKKYQLKLEEYASTDMLTHTLNRSNFLQKAKLNLRAAILQEQPATLAFIDIDNLKKENDQKGHYAGDMLIQTVVQSLRDNVRSTDIIGRYGGDEFIVLFSNCTMQHAERSLLSAQSQLAAYNENTGETYSFTYGLAENSEHPSDNASEYLKNLIDTADQRMLANKSKKKRSRV